MVKTGHGGNSSWSGGSGPDAARKGTIKLKYTSGTPGDVHKILGDGEALNRLPGGRWEATEEIDGYKLSEWGEKGEIGGESARYNGGPDGVSWVKS